MEWFGKVQSTVPFTIQCKLTVTIWQKHCLWFHKQPPLICHPKAFRQERMIYYYCCYYFDPHLKIRLLIFFRERESVCWCRGRGVERNIYVRERHWSFTSCTCQEQGSNPQPSSVPWPGIEPATFWCMGQCSNQLSHPRPGPGPRMTYWYSSTMGSK